MPDTLSPAAQAILVAFRQRYDETLRPGPFVDHWQEQCLAAALRAVADQVEPIEYEVIDNLQYEVRTPVRDALLAIATELETQP